MGFLRITAFTIYFNLHLKYYFFTIYFSKYNIFYVHSLNIYVHTRSSRMDYNASKFHLAHSTLHIILSKLQYLRYKTGVVDVWLVLTLYLTTNWLVLVVTNLTVCTTRVYCVCCLKNLYCFLTVDSVNSCLPYDLNINAYHSNIEINVSILICKLQ